MSRLANAVKNVQANSGITGGRTSIKCTELAEKYPNGIHITGIAHVQNNGSDFFAFTFVEEPGKYFTAGKVLREKTEQLLETYDGNLAELNEDLSKEHLQLFLSNRKSAKYPYVNAGWGKLVPASYFDKTPNVERVIDNETGDIIDNETGEVLNYNDNAPF